MENVSAIQRLQSNAHAFFSRLNAKWVTGVSLGIVALLGWLDYITGFEFSFSFFYLIPIAFCAWYGSGKGAYFVSVASIVVWLVSNKYAGAEYSNEAIRLFNGGVRLLVFLLAAWLFVELKQVNLRESLLARTDPLTGILNSREFFAQAALEIERSTRINYPFSIAYIDFDNFKQVNDLRGHSAGDEHLKLITKCISNTIRKTDVFARLGGDEFALLFPNVDHESVPCVMEKIQKAVEEELRSLHSPVTFSAGVGTFYGRSSSINEMLAMTDSLMYQAKSLGKNRILYSSVEDMSS